jgi:hypothetical protein
LPILGNHRAGIPSTRLRVSLFHHFQHQVVILMLKDELLSPSMQDYASTLLASETDQSASEYAGKGTDAAVNPLALENPSFPHLPRRALHDAGFC